MVGVYHSVLCVKFPFSYIFMDSAWLWLTNRPNKQSKHCPSFVYAARITRGCLTQSLVCHMYCGFSGLLVT